MGWLGLRVRLCVCVCVRAPGCFGAPRGGAFFFWAGPRGAKKKTGGCRALAHTPTSPPPNKQTPTPHAHAHTHAHLLCASSSATILSLPSCSVYSFPMFTTSCRWAAMLDTSSSRRHSSAHSADSVPKNSSSACGSIACTLTIARLMSLRSV